MQNSKRQVSMRPPDVLDYSLVGENAERAVEMGLADAVWYQSPIPRAEMRKLLERRNGPAVRDTLIWFGLLIGFGAMTVVLWPSWWAVLPYLCYAVVYGSSSDSRWHESSHGTAFKTDWMNNALYEIASFMVMRESVVWRWSHTRHHSDTIVVGRDPEISVPRPPDFKAIILGFFNVGVYLKYFRRILMHSVGRMAEDEKTFIPESDYAKVFVRARIYIMIYAAVIASCFLTGGILPLLLVGGTNLFGAWLMPIYGLTQHAGMAENVLDHRLNCRTVKMNLLNRYLYWNMNYHVEHHMFPQVPYHALPKLHALVRDDMPKPYTGLADAWREIIFALKQQVKDPTWHVEREVPPPQEQAVESALVIESTDAPDAEGWVRIGGTDLLLPEDVLRFDHGEETYAVYRTKDGAFYASGGICTHGKTHLATGKVIGCQIECPKHNGRFDVRDGSVQRRPPKTCLRTYPVRIDDGSLYINMTAENG